MKHLFEQNLSLWLKPLISRWTIAEKISYGYGLAIGIGVLGTTVGLIVGEHYERQALKTLTVVEEQQILLLELENSLLQMRNHPQKLLPTLGKAISFDFERSQFVNHVQRVQNNISDLLVFINEHPHHSAIDPREFKQFLIKYEIAVLSYTELINALYKQIAPPDLKPEEIQDAKQDLLIFLNEDVVSPADSEFEDLSEQLIAITETAQTQAEEAQTKLRRALALRIQIITSSMLFSAAIALILAIYTSSNIAKPLTAVTHLAQRVTKESDFNLRVPVVTEDEVGSLAASLNQLIERIGQYTQELEMSRQNLEERVQERTKELTKALGELREAQSQLIQTEKMSSLGQMVGGIAHEINNPVNFIYGNIQHAKEYTEDLLKLVRLYHQEYPQTSPKVSNYIEEIDLEFLAEDLPKIITSMDMGAERIRKIVISLKNFSRLDEAEMKKVDIHEGIDNTLLILNSRLKKNIQVVRDYGDFPFVECYPAQLNQVFMNILANAIDALEEQQEKSNGYKINPAIAICSRRIDSNLIKIKIGDNGPGISTHIKDKLFDPFFTTKHVGKGTGLGLSICYQIVEKHKGKIEVDSQVGQGTEFTITLPIER